MKHSSDAQRVGRHLGKYGIEYRLSGDWFGMELALLRFFPNHITGVVDQVLRGKDQQGKVTRAQQQGWPYFDKPVRSLLSGRTGAVRKDDVVVEPSENLEKLYHLATSTLLDADMNRDEIILLLTEVPSLISEPHDLREAIRICRERGARSIHYLTGILRKGEQRRATRKTEILDARSEQQPWVPPADYRGLSSAALDALAGRWDRLFPTNPDPQGI